MGSIDHLSEAKLPQDKSYPRPPLKLSGVLDKYEHDELTPVIGREYPTIQLRDLLEAPNSEELLRELGIISKLGRLFFDSYLWCVVSRRGVVFFRNQDLTPEEQKEVTDKIARAVGKPASSTLHIHPIINSER